MKIAVIPARGGSKRIPKKNIRQFIDRPIIAYSIQAALEAGCFDKIIVSTDSEEIASVARCYKAEVPFIRPAHISDDKSITADVIKHAINWYAEKGEAIRYVCCIYATAPFISAGVLKRAWEKMSKQNLDFVFSATSFAFPIQRAIKLDHAGRVAMFQPEHLLTRSQDLEEAYHDAGQFYWGSAPAWLEGRPIFGNASSVELLPRDCVQDIDTEEDWRLAEKLFLVNQKHASSDL